MKIKSFYKDQVYIITQSNHGWQQANCAFDFGFAGYSDKNLYALYDLAFKRKWGKDYDGGSEYWICPNVYVQIVHWTPSDNRNFKEGEKMGLVTGDHIHIALNVEGKWQVYLDYADRSARLYFWRFGQEHTRWTNWNTFTSRELNCYTNQEMVKLQKPIKIKTTNTIELNVREKPDTSSKIINKIPTSQEFATDIVASGSEVSGNKTWYGVLGGYISGAFVEEIREEADCSAQDSEIVRLNEEVRKQVEISSQKQSKIDYYLKADEQVKEAFELLKT